MSFTSKVRGWLGIIDLDGYVLDVRSDVLDVREQLSRIELKLDAIAKPTPPKPSVRRQWSEDMPEREA